MDTLQVCLHPTTESLAVVITGESPTCINHSSLASNVQKLRRQLTLRGITRGTKVSIVLSNPYLMTVAFLALTLQRSVVAPLNHGLQTPEFECYYKDIGAELVVLSTTEVDEQGSAYSAAKNSGLRVATCNIVDQEVAFDRFFDAPTPNISISASVPADDVLDGLNKPDPSDVALVLYTSGTTGKPKAVPLTHGNIAHSISTIVTHYALTASDRAPVIMPLFHIHGLVAALFAPLASGGSVIFAPRGGLTPSFHRDSIKYGATWYTGTPTLHKLAVKMLSTTKSEPAKYRFVRSCSSRLEGPLLRELEGLYGCPVVEAYAMTEAAHQVCSNPVDPAKTREGSVGESTGVDVRVLDERGSEVNTGETGEICIKGKSVMTGYLDNAAANAESFTCDGFFRTGDLGRTSEDGYVTLTGRIKEQINKGGEKISPVEVDEVVNQHADVAEAVTFAISDDMYGENVAIAVVRNDGASMTEADLKSWVGQRLLLSKVPKKVFFTTVIPKTAVGKLQRGLVASTILGERY